MRARPSLAAVLLLALAGPVAAQPGGGKAAPGTTAKRLLAPFQEVVAKANASTVAVLAAGKQVALGTVVFADGYVLTKASDLAGEVAVRFRDGSTEPATVVGTHKESDLALLKVEKAGLVPLTFADGKAADRGHWLAAAGAGSDPAAVGIVSVPTRTFGAAERLADAMTGKGLNSNRGFLGISMSPNEPAGGGVEVGEVTKAGAADKAGVKAKDVIVKVDGKAVADTDALVKYLNDKRPGQAVTLSVRRAGEELRLTATLGGVPPSTNRGDFQDNMGGPLSGRRGGFERVLQTDMLVAPKNCGGAVVDLDGRAIGVCIARAGRVETYVLPGELVRAVLADLRAGKYAPPAATSAAPPPPAQVRPVVADDDVSRDKPRPQPRKE